MKSVVQEKEQHSTILSFYVHCLRVLFNYQTPKINWIVKMVWRFFFFFFFFTQVGFSLNFTVVYYCLIYGFEDVVHSFNRYFDTEILETTLIAFHFCFLKSGKLLRIYRTRLKLIIYRQKIDKFQFSRYKGNWRYGAENDTEKMVDTVSENDIKLIFTDLYQLLQLKRI